MANVLKTQMRVVGALVLRETRTRFGKMQLGYLWAFLEPISFVVVLSGIFISIGRKAPFGMDMIMFFGTGILAFQLYRNLAMQLGSAFSANRALLTFPIVQRIDTLYARAILEIATILMVMIILFGSMTLSGLTHLPHDLGQVTLSILGLSVLGFGVGAINAVMNVLLPAWRLIEAMISRPMFFLSGIFYAIDTMPHAIREFLLWNPVLHGVEMMRLGFHTGYRSQSVDITYLLWWGVGTLLIGLSAERVFKRRLSR